MQFNAIGHWFIHEVIQTGKMFKGTFNFSLLTKLNGNNAFEWEEDKAQVTK